MKNTKIQRKFIEEMMRLKRNQIILDKQKSKINIFLKFNESNFIGYSLITKKWTIISDKITTDNWNPKISEILDFLDNYTPWEINNTILEFEKTNQILFGEFNSILLQNKFELLMSLMSLEENQIQPLLKIVLNVKLLKTAENVIYEIAYVEKKFVFSIEFPDAEVSTNWNNFTEKDLKKILLEVKYNDATISLNQTFSQLRIKKLPKNEIYSFGTNFDTSKCDTNQKQTNC